MSRKLEQLGADYLAVSSLDEAKELRRAGIQAVSYTHLHICPDGVGQLAHDGPLLGGELAHLLQNGGQFSLFAQVLDLKLIIF